MTTFVQSKVEVTTFFLLFIRILSTLAMFCILGPRKEETII